ncbi:hypothetical protein APS56_04825 [Pseudalgibacter alginicilyticus]|uniref:Uncharacterized protein n=1 Tax=Pseudalgibacter alginicilyticus TaxID=1736674 RepID=A0A0P0CJG5_9FLAO|nr:hypothetical protein [Pseudalgibacter alginicilyticus]ALJ04503.1 hypothetical protein APS56_04825 [Pseudalgibacter alginicilyticus]
MKIQVWSLTTNSFAAISKTQYLLSEKEKLNFQGKYREADKLKLKDIEIPENAKTTKKKINGIF